MGLSYNQWWTKSDVYLYAEQLNQICADFVIGQEVGESGNPHLQIYLKLKKRSRIVPLLTKLLDIFNPKDKSLVQLEPAQSYKNLELYCQKDSNFITKDDVNISDYDKELASLNLLPKQVNALNALFSMNERQIAVWSDSKGNVGKSKLLSIMISNRQLKTILLPNTGSIQSTNWSIITQLNKHFSRQNGLVVVLVDLTRSDSRLGEIGDLMSICESLTTGLAASCFQGKYQVLNVNPKKIKILICTNQAPQTFLGLLSRDRWVFI